MNSMIACEKFRTTWGENGGGEVSIHPDACIVVVKKYSKTIHLYL
jgi:hypothetical protein